MKRILHVVSCLEKGGTEAFIMNCFRNIDRTRFTFDVLVLSRTSSPYEPEIKQLGGRVIYANASVSIMKFFKEVRVLSNLMKENGPYDIVHCHMDIANSIVLTAAKKAGINKRISHSHNTNFFKGKSFRVLLSKIQQYILLKNATVLCACGDLAGRDLYGEKASFTIINNGIDVIGFTDIPIQLKNKVRFTLGLKEDDIIFTNVSRFSKQKNLPFVVDVFSCIIKSMPNSILIIGGQDGEEKEFVLRKIDKYNISDKVRIVGVRNDMPLILSISDFAIFPSLNEGLSFALLENQAAGVNTFVSTNVSRESDMGLGLMDFLPLEKGAMFWAQSILGHKRNKVSKDKIFKSFQDNGYDIKTSVKKLEALYEQ